MFLLQEMQIFKNYSLFYKLLDIHISVKIGMSKTVISCQIWVNFEGFGFFEEYSSLNGIDKGLWHFRQDR